jgi:hypothetical protein
MPKACQPPRPEPTQNDCPAVRSGAKRWPAQSDGRRKAMVGAKRWSAQSDGRRKAMVANSSQPADHLKP